MGKSRSERHVDVAMLQKSIIISNHPGRVILPSRVAMLESGSFSVIPAKC